MIARFKEPFSGFTHLGGAILGLIGLAWLVALTADDPPRMISMIVYGVSLVLLYSASAALHLIHASPRLFQWLVRFDHAAIFALIAGTYTPLCYNLLTGTWRWGMLGTIWGLAVVGIVYKLFWMKQSGHLSTLLYVGMGWLAVAAIPQWIGVLPAGAWALIVSGGLLYSVGAVVFAARRPNFHPQFNFHDLWHLFVLAGSACHFAAVALYVA